MNDKDRLPTPGRPTSMIEAQGSREVGLSSIGTVGSLMAVERLFDDNPLGSRTRRYDCDT